jgi:pimeloyl-ACP methyl ester carboxylesterase
MITTSQERIVRIPAGDFSLEGGMVLPDQAKGMVVFAHGSGSSRHSPRNKYVAQVLQEGSFGTLLIDLLTPREDQINAKRFDIDLLTERLLLVTKWFRNEIGSKSLPIGYFGASTGAAAALKAAATAGTDISAVVSRGGRPDLAISVIDAVTAPTLFLVGGRDEEVIELNQQAYAKMRAKKELMVIPGASHLFEEAGKLEDVASLAATWFADHLQ